MSSTVVTSTQTRSKQRWIDAVLLAVVLAMVAVTAWQYFSQCDTFDCPNVTAFIRSFGPWTPLAYAVVYVAGSPVPFVAVVLSAAGGLLFGTTLGTLYALVVATVSSLLPFFLARRLGREWVESKLRGKKLDHVYQQSGGRDGFVFVVLMRLIPILPWEVQNYTAGLTNVSVPTFILATLLGAIPGTFSNVFLGSSAMDVGSGRFAVALALNAVIISMPLIAIYVRKVRSRRNKNKGAI